MVAGSSQHLDGPGTPKGERASGSRLCLGHPGEEDLVGSSKGHCGGGTGRCLESPLASLPTPSEHPENSWI